MKKFRLTPIASAMLIGSAVAMTGCSSSSSGGGAAAVPANATTVTSANGDDLAVFALALAEAIQEPIEDEFCSESGNVFVTGTGTSSSYSGSATFSSCKQFGNPITIASGTANGNGTFNISSGDYTDNASGTGIAGTAAGLGYPNFTVTSFAFTESGNEFSDTYSVSALRFSIDTPLGGGFAVNLVSPLTGTGSTCSSGSVDISGASSSKATITVNSLTQSYDVFVGGVLINSIPC